MPRVQGCMALSTRIRNLDYDVVRSNRYGDYMDSATFLDMFATESGHNRTGWSNARYDELIAAAVRDILLIHRARPRDRKGAIRGGVQQ